MYNNEIFDLIADVYNLKSQSQITAIYGQILNKLKKKNPAANCLSVKNFLLAQKSIIDVIKK